MCTVDQRVGAILLPSSRRSGRAGRAGRGRGTKNAKRTTGRRKRRPERQLRCRNNFARCGTSGCWSSRGDRRDGAIACVGRGGGQHICHQALVPAGDGVVHVPAVARAPMPIKRVVAARVPVPFDRVPKPVDCGAQLGFVRRRRRKKLPRAEQAGHQECGLHQVAAIVLFARTEWPHPVAPCRKCGKTP